jgi:pimeloyl-ACP methyl ester carboxylesterase
VPNPGGPGSPATSFAAYYSAFAPLRARRDILLIDPRGTGRSGALSCPALAQVDPLNVRKDVVAVCAHDVGPRPSLYGSAAVADDIDAVRAALGRLPSRLASGRSSMPSRPTTRRASRRPSSASADRDGCSPPSPLR